MPPSLSTRVTVAEAALPREAPPVGFDSVTTTVSGLSARASAITGTAKVREATPAAKVSVPGASA